MSFETDLFLFRSPSFETTVPGPQTLSSLSRTVSSPWEQLSRIPTPFTLAAPNTRRFLGSPRSTDRTTIRGESHNDVGTTQPRPKTHPVPPYGLYDPSTIFSSAGIHLPQAGIGDKQSAKSPAVRVPTGFLDFRVSFSTSTLWSYLSDMTEDIAPDDISQALVREAVAEHSVDHRQAILLARIERLPIREVAERMNRTPDAVIRSLSRSLTGTIR